MSHYKRQREAKALKLKNRIAIATLSVEYDVPTDYSNKEYFLRPMVREVIVFDPKPGNPQEGKYTLLRHTWREYSGEGSGKGAYCSLVTTEGISCYTGEREALYGYHAEGRLVVEYSDSGRELSAKQVFDQNIYRSNFTHFWVKPYYVRDDNPQHFHTPDPGPVEVASKSFEWEV